VWARSGDVWYLMDEYRYSGRDTGVQKTDDDYVRDMERFTDKLPQKYRHGVTIIIDPSAASFIASLRKRGFSIRKANNDVLDGIRRTAVYLKNGNIKIHRSCEDAIAEFGLYRWDEKASADTVIKENDHAMDDIRYFSNTILKNKIGKTNYTSIFL
jgi:phage terminase large subunit